MEGALCEKIKAEVLKTGFPLELRVAELLVQRGYFTAHSLYYVDEEENKAREVDLRALKNIEGEDEEDHWSTWFVRHCLLVECKKSDSKPWVFTSSKANPYDPELGGIPTYPKDLAWNLGVIDGTIHPFSQYETRGRGYFEAFKGFEAGDMIMKALTTAVKATLYTMKRGFATGSRCATLYYPVVVYDGKLFEASLSGQDVEVEEVESLLVSFMYESATYPDGSFTVPVLTEAALPGFLDSLERFLEALSEVAFADKDQFFAPSKQESAEE